MPVVRCKVIKQEGDTLILDCPGTGDNIKVKSKRKPSAYNLFMKDCIKKSSGPIKERFRECAKRYKEQKDKK